MQQKASSESKIVISEVMMPHQANVAGNIHGGEIIKIMDSCAYATARRYSRTNVVTARIDEVQFHLPIFIGDLLMRVLYRVRPYEAVPGSANELYHKWNEKAKK